ncbi:restriction endonuclease subunit S, partial [Dysgonomonas macrotermitis]
FEPFKGGKFVGSELGEIPEGWRVGKLIEIADIIMGQSPQGRSFNEVGDGIVFYQGRTEFGDRFPSIRLYTTEPNRFAEPLSVLLSVRAPVGDINIAHRKCCIGRGLASIKSNNAHYSFIFYTMQSLKPLLDKFNGEGTVFGSINRSSIENMTIVIPPNDIIERFERITQKIDMKILNSFNESNNLKEQRDILLPKLISGELKINDL